MYIRIFFFLFSIISIPAHSQNAGYQQVNSKEFYMLIRKKDGVLLDVRTWSEFSNGHIPNAGYLNYYALDFKKKLMLLPKDQPIYLYCNTGYRSEKAAAFLAKSGYKNLYNLEHGIMEWELNELPEVQEPGARPDIVNKMDVEEYQNLLQSDELVFFDFYAPWCGPCRKMMPMIDSLKTEYHPRIHIVKVNADASKKLVKEMKLIGVPYLQFSYKGNIIYNKEGSATREELVAVFRKALNLNGNMK